MLGVIKTMGGTGRVIEVRDEFMPVLDLEQVFDVPRFNYDNAGGIVVVAEAEGGRVAMLVDEAGRTLGHQQRSAAAARHLFDPGAHLRR